MSATESAVATVIIVCIFVSWSVSFVVAHTELESVRDYSQGILSSQCLPKFHQWALLKFSLDGQSRTATHVCICHRLSTCYVYQFHHIEIVSDYRESDPDINHGKVVGYRYIIVAKC